MKTLYVKDVPVQEVKMKLGKLEAFIKMIQDEDLREATRKYLAYYWEDFSKVPGSLRYHHAYTGGLLKHTEDKVKKLFKEKGLSRKEKYLLMIPGASYGSSKCWPPDYFAKVADHIEVEFGLKVVIAPGPNEEDIAFRIKENMKSEPIIFVDPILSLKELKDGTI